MIGLQDATDHPGQTAIHNGVRLETGAIIVYSSPGRQLRENRTLASRRKLATRTLRLCYPRIGGAFKTNWLKESGQSSTERIVRI